MENWNLLTDQEIQEVEVIWALNDELSTFADAARLIEQKVIEKNK